MAYQGLFRKPKNALEVWDGEVSAGGPRIADDTYVQCPGCKKMLHREETADNLDVCPECGYYFKMTVRRRIAMIADEGTFIEMFTEIGAEVRNPIQFPGYEEKLFSAAEKSGESEGVLCGRAQVGGLDTCLFVMNADFMIGSMGTVVGERLTRLFEYALAERLPVIGYAVSGGARMQEGILSLMQMAKVSGAVKRHSDAGLLYAVVLTDPTTGGVTASFAMEGDVILAEPGALIGFAGPRVIEQTILQKLPEGFQRAEFLLEKGFIDDIIPRENQRKYFINLLGLHSDKITI